MASVTLEQLREIFKTTSGREIPLLETRLKVMNVWRPPELLALVPVPLDDSLLPLVLLLFLLLLLILLVFFFVPLDFPLLPCSYCVF